MSLGAKGAGSRLGLVVDIQTVQSVRFGERGIPRYAGDYSRALLRAGAPVVGLAMNPTLPVPRGLHPELADSAQLCWNTAREIGRLRERGPLAYHVMSTLEANRPVQGTLPRHAVRGDVPLVCTLYDLIPERLKVFEPRSQFARLYELRRNLVRSSELVFTISDATRRDALELLGLDPERVINVGTGASEFFCPPAPHERPLDVVARHVPDLGRPFVMGVTGVFGLDTRKNTEGLIAAFARLPGPVRRAHQLVVACRLSAEDRSRWLQVGVDHGLTEGELVITGYVSDLVLRALYRSAAVFVYPSLYEGFGLPPLEAARCECATITSNTSALPEVLSFPEATFDPRDTQELAALLERSLVDDEFRTSLRTAAVAAGRRHTWERVAQRAIAGYRRLDPPRLRSSRRLRIALVGPLPPAQAVTAARNHDLALRLAERCHLDCIADGVTRGPTTRRNYGIFPSRAFGPHVSPYGYDAVFYTLAPGREHDRTYEKALGYPGIVWFHDIALADLYLEFARARFLDDEGRQFMTNTLRNHYRERFPDELVAGEDWGSPDAYERYGAFMAGELAAKSRGSIVGSDEERQKLELDIGPSARPPRTWVLPAAGAATTESSSWTVDDIVESVLEIARWDRAVRER
ncbi:MAG TPA: glycosyltransferase family 1 protein [Acidimicrobiales bacterium]